MKKIRTGVISQLLTLCMALAVILTGPLADTAAASEMHSGTWQSGAYLYNIVLLIDKSGSMNYTDPNRIAVNAAKMFVDSLYTGVRNKIELGESVHTTVSVIPFSRDPDTAQPPVELNSEADASGITQYIDTIAYDPVNTGATDLGKAVTAAVSRLRESSDGSQAVRIVLFTDGYTDYLSSEPQKEELEAQSAQMLEEALNQARSMGCEIDVIGLNYVDTSGQERIQAEGRDEIVHIANATQIQGREGLVPMEDGSRVNYLITSSYGQIQSFYINLFASMMDSIPPLACVPGDQTPPADNPPQDGNWIYYDIPMGPGGLSCANVYLTSEQAVGGVMVWDAAGTYVRDGSRISEKRDSENKYVITSIWRPGKGTWRLAVQAMASEIQVRYVPISGVRLDITDGTENNGTTPLTVRASFAGTPMDADFYNALTMKTYEVSGDQAQPASALEYNAGENLLSGQMPSGGNTVSVTLATDLMRISARKTLNPTAQPSELRIMPLEVTIKQGKKVTVDLQDALADQNTGAVLTADSKDAVEWTSKRHTKVDADGSSMTVRGRGILPGTVEFTLHATESLNHQSVEIPVTVEITFNPMYYLPWLIALLIVILAVILCLILFNRKQPGMFTIDCRQMGRPFVHKQTQRYPGGKSFTLYQLLRMNLRQESDTEASGFFEDRLDGGLRDILKAPDYRIYRQPGMYAIGPAQKPLYQETLVFQDTQTDVSIYLHFEAGSAGYAYDSGQNNYDYGNAQNNYDYGNAQNSYGHDNAQNGYDYGNAQNDYGYDNAQNGYDYGNAQSGYGYDNGSNETDVIQNPPRNGMQ